MSSMNLCWDRGNHQPTWPLQLHHPMSAAQNGEITDPGRFRASILDKPIRSKHPWNADMAQKLRRLPFVSEGASFLREALKRFHKCRKVTHNIPEHGDCLACCRSLVSRPSRAYSAVIDSSFANAIRASILDRNHGIVLPLTIHLQAGAAAFANDILVLSLTVWVWMGATGHVQVRKHVEKKQEWKEDATVAL